MSIRALACGIVLIGAMYAPLANGMDGVKTQTVPAWQWVKKAVSGDTVGVEYGGKLKEVGRDGSRVLARYVKTSGRRGGTEAEVGDLVWIDADDFDSMTERYYERVAEKRAEVDLVRKLLEQER